jgi:dolichyl-phosphate-mannose--protein O-mannosyl transferase
VTLTSEETSSADVPADEPVGPDSPVDVETAPPGPVRPVASALNPGNEPSVWGGWTMTALVTGIAALTRLWALAWPKGKSFDEVYYATEAQEMLRFGYEDNRGYLFIVHPPLGKWLIGFTSELFGNHEFGWRLAPAIAGILSVLLLARVARRMFRSNFFGGIAGLLLALDGVSLVQSRVALLDIFLQVFIIAGFGALVVDRDQLRSRLAALVEGGVDLSERVPVLGPRPWRLVSGVMFGAALSVKWTALSFWIGFLVLSLVWDRGALKSAGVRRSWRTAARRSWLGAIGSMIVAPVATYLLSYTGWFAGENGYNRHWADAHSASGHIDLPKVGIRIPINWGFVPGPIRALGDDTYRAYVFHEGLDSGHAYGSKPWSWLLLGRPVDYYYEGSPAVKGCGSSNCAREILLIGTPLMWWAFIPMLVWLAWHWATTRDWRAASVWLAFAAGWLVWFQDLKRTMFLFYMIPLIPFLILGLTLALGVMLGPAVERSGDVMAFLRADRRRMWGSLAVAVYLGLVVADFGWMWPLFSGGKLTYEQWHLHMWFPSWV